MKRLLVLCALVGMMALPASSQMVNETPRYDVSFGYSRAGGDIGMNGWEAAATWRANQWVGIVGDISGHYGSDNVLGVGFDSNLHNFLVGPRVFVPLADYPNWKPFGQFLFGASRVNETVEDSVIGGGTVIPGFAQTDTAFSWVLGGGLDYQLHEQFRVRVVQLDLLRTNFFDTGQSRMRLGFGVVYQFGQ